MPLRYGFLKRLNESVVPMGWLLNSASEKVYSLFSDGDFMMNGFIKLYRSLLDWDWIAEPNTLSVFIQLLLRARFVNGHWKGVSIESGQLITSLKSLSSATGLSIQSVRTSLKHLESTGEITVKVTNKYRIITVTNWGKYQTISPSATNKSTDYLTDSQQVANRHLADNQQQRKNEEKRNDS